MSELTCDLDKIPKTLKLLMGQIFVTNMLNSWSIYENKDGFVVINIRFNQNTEHVTPDQSISYRRISAKQMNRNKQRTQSHQNHNVDSPTTQTKKRKILDMSPEQNRMEACTVSYNTNIDTPEIVPSRPVEPDYMAEYDNQYDKNFIETSLATVICLTSPSEELKSDSVSSDVKPLLVAVDTDVLHCEHVTSHPSSEHRCIKSSTYKP